MSGSTRRIGIGGREKETQLGILKAVALGKRDTIGQRVVQV